MGNALEGTFSIVFTTRLPALFLTTFFTLTSFVAVAPTVGFVCVKKT